MKRVTIFGHFGFGKELANGQTIKTKIVTKELENQFGEDQVVKVDTVGGFKALPKMFFKCRKALKQSKNVIMMPAHNGVKVFTPMLLFFNKFYKRKLFYVVIGGWLPKLLENKKVLANQLKRFDCIFVETNSMKVKLEQVGFNNIEVVPNCKELTILDDCSKDLWSSPFRFCVFSRVNRKKGIEDAVNVVRKLNEEANSHIATLDIYGNIDKGEEEWFASLQKSFDSSISYRGVVNFKESVDILKQYYALLFSTRYYTEGVPGTIIDAYAAGVPVISSKWESFSDVIEDGVTGFGYEFGNFEDLKVKIKQAIEQQSVWMGLKNNCLKRANDFTPKEAMKILFEKLEV